MTDNLSTFMIRYHIWINTKRSNQQGRSPSTNLGHTLHRTVWVKALAFNKVLQKDLLEQVLPELARAQPPCWIRCVPRHLVAVPQCSPDLDKFR